MKNKTVKVPKNAIGALRSIPTLLRQSDWNKRVPEKKEYLFQPSEELKEKIMGNGSDRVMKMGELINRVVYDSLNPFSGSSGSKRGTSSLGIRMKKQQKVLEFESRFECGNLRRAVQIFPFEYDLVLNFDTNSRGHSQWFFFSVFNVERGTKYRFNIINFLKGKSLYAQGMKPCVFSEYEARHFKRGWTRGRDYVSDICYFQNNIRRKIKNKSKFFNTLSFSVTFKHNCKYYFSYGYPYGYSELQRHLAVLDRSLSRRRYIQKRVLCKTLSGNNCIALTITNFHSHRPKRAVFLTARVHPGETPSSLVMKGIVNFLTNPKKIDSRILRDNFVFYVVPMLNPDGVISGNTRCSLAGCDLNRKWRNPSRKLNPTIFFTKKFIRKVHHSGVGISLFCDFHAHSRNKNVFMYGCPGTGMETRLFPRILHSNSNIFSFQDCKFEVSARKRNTARAVLYKGFGIPLSYTLETSFCGTNFGKFCNVHFNQRDFENLGRDFCRSILDLFDPDQIKVQEAKREIFMLYPHMDVDFSPVFSPKHHHASKPEGRNVNSGSRGVIIDDELFRIRRRKEKEKKKRMMMRRRLKEKKKIAVLMSESGDAILVEDVSLPQII